MHTMRRQDKTQSREEAQRFLAEGSIGMLSTKGSDEYPHAVPVNYIYLEGAIYFHGAAAGTKIECIAADPHVSFCVIHQNKPMPEKFTTHYLSAIALGRAQMITDAAEKTRILKAIATRFAPETAGADGYIANVLDKVGVFRIEIDSLTAKGVA